MSSQNPAVNLQQTPSSIVGVKGAKNSNWSILCGSSPHSAYSIFC